LIDTGAHSEALHAEFSERKTLKVRHRYYFNRLSLSATAVLLGILAGYFVGRESILHTAKSRLSAYADRVLEHDEELSAEIVYVLTQAGASTYPPCSDEDIVLLRRLTFAARFLKDVGRLHEGYLLCSATTGKLPVPIALPKPDITFSSGREMFTSYPLQIPAGAHAGVVASRIADVVLSPDVFSEFLQEPIQFATGVPEKENLVHLRTDSHGAHRPGDTVLSGATGIVLIPAGVLESQQARRIGDTIYRARCSERYSVCAVTSIRIPVMWKTYRALQLGYIATGGVAGIACASALLIVGRKRRSHSNQLKRAILMGKLSVVYQPMVELGSHRIVGAEALARWTDEEGESIRPETIIALAEAEGFVSEITRFILTRSMEEIRPILEWNPAFRLSINLAASDLADPRLLILLDERLNGSQMTPANIAFELPERATSDREVAAASIRRLRERGHTIFIDDFGTGYSNLAYLSELHVDGIKINRSFIATIGTESVTASIVPQILAVAKAFNLSVIVQGIEREDQASYFVTDNPTILGQGWFFGLPVPAKGLMYLCAEKSE
jgi:sensor c-di-GMP phosphodiesterase-like protein